MKRRSQPARDYGQYCSLARALDVVGERWTLLLVRELLAGPRRFKDLKDGLPGMGTNLLAARLRALAAAGVLERVHLPPPASVEAYALTARGRELEPALIALARWGMPLLGSFKRGQVLAPQWGLLGMKAAFRPEAARGVHDTYQLEVGGNVFHVIVEDGALEAATGPARSPTLVVRTDPETLLRLAAREVGIDEARRTGRLHLEGDRAAAARCLAIFAIRGGRS